MSRVRVYRRDLENFIKEKLINKLRNDLRKIRIVREAELECCCYYHLRKFLRKDSRWKVLVEKHTKRTGRYIDLLIFYDSKPKIAIELKWNKKYISKKDRESLRGSINKLKVKRSYFITTVIPNDFGYRKSSKKSYEQYRLFELPIGLNISSDKFKRWKIKRKEFKKFLQ